MSAPEGTPPGPSRQAEGARVAAVTAASSGLGRAIAVALARRGFAVALGARRVERLAALRTWW